MIRSSADLGAHRPLSPGRPIVPFASDNGPYVRSRHFGRRRAPAPPSEPTRVRISDWQVPATPVGKFPGKKSGVVGVGIWGFSSGGAAP
jgi:hypothetical protein